MKTFTEKVLDVVRKIPKGKTMTYGQVAKNAGGSGASRAVGSIMKKNFDPTVPCHRVVPANAILSGALGTLRVGAYNRGTNQKIKKLKSEGAIIVYKK